MEGFTTKKQQFATVWKMHTAGDAQWYPAQVPGTVYTDLLRNGQMEDPFWKDNEYRALDLMEKDYEYETVFEGTEAQEGERQWLRFEGLDTICDIYLNEEKIGNTYNMHRTWEFDVTGKVKAGENILRVYFHSPLEYIKEAYEKQPTHGSEDAMDGFVHIRKAHCMFGWDWGAHLPDAGIFRPVYLLTMTEGRIDSVYIRQEHEEGKVTLHFDVSRNPKEDLRKEIPVGKEADGYTYEVTVTAPDGTKIIAKDTPEDLVIEQPKLWWPNGVGEQPLYEVNVTLAKDGKVVCTKPLTTAVAPLSEETYDLPIAKQERPGEYTVTVSFHLKADTVWAKAGHEVAFGQYVYQVEKAPVACTDEIEVIRSTHDIGIRGAHFEVLFSALNGGLVSYKYAGREMIESIPKPNFWRAPIDNDCGNLMQMRYAQWKIASMYLNFKDYRDGIYVGGHQPQLEVKEHSAVVSYTYVMPTTPMAECHISYEVFGDGRVKTTLTYDPVKELGDMPEFGVMFKFNADYDHVEWYGLGEAETYADRKHGAKLGIYQNLVEDNMAKYMVPQECGNKVGVRWASVTDRKGRGMLFTGDAMEFSALPYTPHEMENAMHPFELPQVHYTVVRVSKQQMGIAGDDSWGAKPLPEYLIKTDEKMEFTFTFKGI